MTSAPGDRRAAARVAEEMGAVLIRSAFSANIKERRDCSTALFDERGRMIAQAEHIPVHLGAMPDAVAAAMRSGRARARSASSTTRTRAARTCPTSRSSRAPSLGYAVSRAHHADVGGMEPASLPAFSRELYQEGVIIPPSRSPTRCSSASSRTRATRTSAAATSARRSPRIASPSGGSTSSASDAAASASPRRWTSSTRTRSGWCARRSRGCRTAAARPRTSSRRSRASCRSARRSRSRATRSGSTSPARRRSTTATSTARCP